MKATVVLRIFLLSILVFFSQKKYSTTILELKKDTIVCLEISGRVELGSESKTDKKVKIELIYYNSVIDSLTLKTGKAFKFYLKKDACYTIRMSKPGYITRIVTIYTNVKKFDPEEGYYKYDFDTELLPELATEILDKEVLEFPIAIVSYNDKLKGFQINDKYTRNIKKESFQK